MVMHHYYDLFFFFFNDTATTEIYTLSLHDALPILISLPTMWKGIVGYRWCIARMTRARTVPSPTPASNTLTAGGRGCILASSMPTRCATTHFSLQVLTNSKYFWRLS